MSNGTGLAAVMAAADSVSRSDHEAALATAREQARGEGLAAGRAEGLKAGADAERARLAGIDAHALKGHEALIAAIKADGSVTPDMAAGRILAAEKKLRDAQMTGIAGVETHTGKVGADATSQRRDDAAATPAAAKGKTPGEWKAEFEASSALQSEFASVEDYVAVRKAEAAGKIKVFEPGRAR